MSTDTNLKAAFAGESQANRRYLAYAKKADQEGFGQVAKLFRAAADAETVHALKHLSVLEGVGATADNLKDAVKGETYEFDQMYPEFLKEARAEENKAAANSFFRANEVEKIHAGLYQLALDNLGNNTQVEYYVCQVCGNTVEGEPPDICPICSSKKEDFKLID